VRNPVSLARRVMSDTPHVLLVGEGASAFADSIGFPRCSEDELRLPERAIRAETSDTVGAVAIDGAGNLACATSTGGVPRKLAGRVGDSPIIGSGTYADNKFGAVSCTGWGESIMRVVLAKSVVDQIEINGGDVDKAVRHGLYLLETRVKGYGGLIAISRDGRVSTIHNTPRMARGYITSEMQKPVVEV